MNDYTAAVRAELATGIAAEHAYRPALKALLEALDPEVTAVNDPKRIDCGAPDFIITRGGNPEAYVEAKDNDIDGGLGKVQRGEQLKRYREALPNLILTDYLEFRWYVEGELRGSPGALPWPADCSGVRSDCQAWYGKPTGDPPKGAGDRVNGGHADADRVVTSRSTGV